MSPREKSNSEEIATRHPRHVQSISYTKGSLLQQQPVQGSKAHYYQPTPSPETVVVHSVPKKTNDACCWGCAAALCLCFGLEECCSH